MWNCGGAWRCGHKLGWPIEWEKGERIAREGKEDDKARLEPGRDENGWDGMGWTVDGGEDANSGGSG